eukprot:1569565-Amphidinium_carterae.1
MVEFGCHRPVFYNGSGNENLVQLFVPISKTFLGVSQLVGVRKAERFDLAPGDTWLPIADSNPSGPHFAVIVAGRVRALGGCTSEGTCRYLRCA